MDKKCAELKLCCAFTRKSLRNEEKTNGTYMSWMKPTSVWAAKKPRCQQGCPIQTNIPEVIRLLKANSWTKQAACCVALRIGDKGALFRSAQLKFVFAAADQPTVPHFAQLLGKCAAVQVQVVRQLLAVKRDGKMRAARPHCLRGKIGQQSAHAHFLVWCTGCVGRAPGFSA